MVPAKLAELLRAQQLDAALVSVAEVLHHDHYEVLDGVAIASTGAVYSVHLAHRRPLEELSEIYCDPASLTGANLLRVLLAEWNLRLSLRPLPDYRLAAECDAVLLIGDEAIDFQLGGHPHHILDLGTAWHQLTGLPFVYAVWALRRGLDHACLRQTLRRARDLGLGALEEIIRTHPAYTVDFRRQYFRRHVQYQLGPSEKRGIGKFIELLRRHDLGPVYEPRYAD